MKRFILILIAVVSILGCCKEKPDTPVTPEEPKETTYTIDSKAMFDYYTEACERGLLELRVFVVEKNADGRSIATHSYSIVNQDNHIKTYHPDSQCVYILIEYSATTYDIDLVHTDTINRWLSDRFFVTKDKDTSIRPTRDTPHQNYEPVFN